MRVSERTEGEGVYKKKVKEHCEVCGIRMEWLDEAKRGDKPVGSE